MHVQFATCVRKTALEYLRKVCPEIVIEDTEDSLGPALDLVQKDIIRVQDPMMYGSRIGIVPGKNWDESKRDEVMKAFSSII